MRPDRQCQLYSATFKKRIEKLARDVLSDPVRVAQGDLGSASELVTQVRNKVVAKKSLIFPDCESGSTGWVQVAMAGEELGAVHERGLDHHLCHQEAKLRGAGAQPKGQGGNQLQVTFFIFIF